MTEEMPNKNQYVTNQELKEALSKQTGIIIDAVDKMLAKQSNEVNGHLDAVDRRFDHVNTGFASVINRIEGLCEELYSVRDELKQDINNVQTLIDSYVKVQESAYRQTGISGRSLLL